MTFSKLSLIFLVGSMAYSFPAFGQNTSDGTPISDHQSSAPVPSTGSAALLPRQASGTELVGTEARVKFYEFAHCVARQNREAVRAYVQRVNVWSDSVNERWAGAQNTMSRCLTRQGGGYLQASNKLLLGAFARELYLAQFQSVPPISQQSILPLATAQDASIDWVPLRFAECVVMAAPGGVDNLIRAQPESSSERESLEALSSVYQSCIPQNTRLTTNRFNLRLLLSDFLYRHAIAGNTESAGAIR